jgi:hypothetical protein
MKKLLSVIDNVPALRAGMVPALCAGMVLLLCAPGCNSKHSAALEGAGALAASEAAEPLAVPVRALAIHGELRARTGGAWRTMAVADEIVGVTELEATGKGAVVALGAPGAGKDRIWLRGGTRMGLAQSRRGVLIDIRAGQARVSSDAISAYARTAHATVEFTGRDVLLRRSGPGADMALAFTSAQPERAAWSLALEHEPEAAGIGIIEVPGPAGNGDGERKLLELRRLDISVVRAGDHAFTEVEHVFYNPNEQQLEGTFRFPLPDGAMPLGLAMEINGRMMEGEIVEREKARTVYESIVDAMQDPALLEWQEGNRFKLRVFPIEPMSEKRVVFRYAAPLAPTIDGWEYVYATQAPDMQAAIPQFRLRFDGKVIVDRQDFAAGEDVVVPVAAVPVAVREVRDAGGQPDGVSDAVAGIYTALRLEPDWNRIDPASGDQGQDPGRTLLIIMDTSRSALEGRDLAMQTLELTLAELGPEDRFLVMAADIEIRAHADGFVAATPETTRAALEHIAAIEPDGASDLGAALARAGELLAGAGSASGRATEMIYIGDGTPTWGITEHDALRAHIDTSLAGVPGHVVVHAAIIGKGASTSEWQRIAGERAGRTARPRSVADAGRFAFLATRSATAARIEGVRIEGTDQHTTILPAGETTLYRGDAMVAVMRTASGQTPPAELTLRGRHAGKPFRQTVRVFQAASAPAPAPLVAQRWAMHRIAELEAGGADKAEIVALSQNFGVMSKHTSLLVLESEEAYRQHGIERRQALAQNTPRVSGGDLESLGERRASLSPDHIQPGDPEIRIPAPADARSVVVIFPFGDTKLARFDDDANAWIARFLIDKDTPDGQYMVLVKVTMNDGSIQTYRLPYYVDTKAPAVNFTFQRRRSDYLITARQVITEAEMIGLGGGSGPAQIVEDARRVELELPGGRVLALARKSPGLFQRAWRPRAPLTAPVTMRVVVTDEALNQSVFALTLNPDGTFHVEASEQ